MAVQEGGGMMTVEQLAEQLAAFCPGCAQEEADRERMVRFLRAHDRALLREEEEGHFSASAWIVDPAREQVLMVYHNIYQAWTWIGGHADGEADLLGVALRETQEETGVTSARPVLPGIFSLEILPVPAHMRRGIAVPEHLHFNVTYLLEVETSAPLRGNPDENSGVRWRCLEEVERDDSEACMLPVYRKLVARVRAL